MNSCFNCRVYYEDTDAGGVVYYANYLKFAERARTELLRERGIIQSELLEKEQLCFVVRKAEIDFLSPARLDDLITIYSTITSISGASLAIEQTLKREEQTLAFVKVVVVSLNSDSMKPTRITEKIKQAL